MFSSNQTNISSDNVSQSNMHLFAVCLPSLYLYLVVNINVYKLFWYTISTIWITIHRSIWYHDTLLYPNLYWIFHNSTVYWRITTEETSDCDMSSFLGCLLVLTCTYCKSFRHLIYICELPSFINYKFVSMMSKFIFPGQLWYVTLINMEVP